MLLTNQFKQVITSPQAVGIDSESEYKWSEEEANSPIKPLQQAKPKKKKEIVVIKRPVI